MSPDEGGVGYNMEYGWKTSITCERGSVVQRSRSFGLANKEAASCQHAKLDHAGKRQLRCQSSVLLTKQQRTYNGIAFRFLAFASRMLK